MFVHPKMHAILRIGLKTLDLIELFFNFSALRSYAAEFISTFLFVFIAVGTVISAGKNTPHAEGDETAELAVALGYAFALFMAVFAAAKFSGGHLNPAVTLGLVVGGRLKLATGILYCISQLLGSIAACFLLTIVASSEALPVLGLASNIGVLGGTTIEMTTTFALVYVMCVARDYTTGIMRVSGAAAVGFAGGAGVLATGALTGGSMNPARSFGPAVVAGDFTNQWVYWVGPLLGGVLAVFVHNRCAPAPPEVSETV